MHVLSEYLKAKYVRDMLAIWWRFEREWNHGSGRLHLHSRWKAIWQDPCRNHVNGWANGLSLFNLVLM